MRTVRELDLPLKQIKFFLENPGLDKNQLLSSQKRMLEHKKERLEGIISSIEDILKGDKKMDFSVFERSEIEQMYSDMESNMTDEQKDCFVKNMAAWKSLRNSFWTRPPANRRRKILKR